MTFVTRTSLWRSARLSTQFTSSTLVLTQLPANLLSCLGTGKNCSRTTAFPSTTKRRIRLLPQSSLMAMIGKRCVMALLKCLDLHFRAFQGWHLPTPRSPSLSMIVQPPQDCLFVVYHDHFPTVRSPCHHRFGKRRTQGRTLLAARRLYLQLARQHHIALSHHCHLRDLTPICPALSKHCRSRHAMTHSSVGTLPENGALRNHRRLSK